MFRADFVFAHEKRAIGRMFVSILFQVRGIRVERSGLHERRSEAQTTTPTHRLIRLARRHSAPWKGRGEVFAEFLTR